MHQQPLIHYIKKHTKVVPAGTGEAPAIIHLVDTDITLRGEPRRDKLEELSRRFANYVALEKKVRLGDAKSKEPAERLTAAQFRPFDGLQYTHVDIDRWIGNLHRTWRESLKPSEKRHPEAQDLTPEKVKMLSLQFMAVASATGLTKLISPQRLIVDEMEATARTLAQDVELKRTQLPSDDSPARKAALADLEKAQELLARKQDDVTHYKEASWRRGFYAITSDSGMIELRQHIASSRLLGLPREESVRPANAHALTQG